MRRVNQSSVARIETTSPQITSRLILTGAVFDLIGIDGASSVAEVARFLPINRRRAKEMMRIKWPAGSCH